MVDSFDLNEFFELSVRWCVCICMHMCVCVRRWIAASLIISLSDNFDLVYRRGGPTSTRLSSGGFPIAR